MLGRRIDHGPDPPSPRRPPRVRSRSRRRARLSDDRGSAAVEFVICAAAMVLLLLMVVQVAVWYHTRAVAQTAARQGLDHVRVLNGSPEEGVAVAHEFLAQSGGGLHDPEVNATRSVELSTVSVRGHVVSLLPGVSFTVSVTVDAATERIEP